MYSREFPQRRRSNPNGADMAAARHRPKSMPDFASLLDTSYVPLAGVPEDARQHPRKKPSISLAAGLIMASETQMHAHTHSHSQSQTSTSSPRGFGTSATTSPKQMQPLVNGGRNEVEVGKEDGGWSDSLFYAYAQKSDYSQYPPYILTFASAAIAHEWWTLVQSEYPSSTRVGPQLFVLKSDDMQTQIQDNPRFESLRNKWFYTPSSSSGTGVIPLQDWKGHPITSTTTPNLSIPQQQQPPTSDRESVTAGGNEPTFDLTQLSTTLSKMNTMILENSTAIRALSVAQSEGLQRMQEINETSTTQIKALTDNQTKLSSLIDSNATHYLALANSSFTAQEQFRTALQGNVDAIQKLAEGQTRFAETYQGITRAVEKLTETVAKVQNISLSPSSSALSPARTSKFLRSDRLPPSPPSSTSASATSPTNPNRSLSSNLSSHSSSSLAHIPGSIIGNKISPPPRKLNRRIKGVWYEYDDTPSASASASASPTLSSPRKSVQFLEADHGGAGAGVGSPRSTKTS